MSSKETNMNCCCEVLARHVDVVDMRTCHHCAVHGNFPITSQNNHD